MTSRPPMLRSEGNNVRWQNHVSAQGQASVHADFDDCEPTLSTPRIKPISAAQSFYKQLILVAAYIGIFLLVDRASLEAMTWEGAPPWYLPNGLSLALLICGGIRYAPVVLVSSLAGALLNYHRPFWGWSGLPGVIAINLPF